MNQGQRFDDEGLGKLIKTYWPAICLIFALGGLYQEARTNTVLSQKLQIKTEDHDKRLTQVEDAVKYLAQVVKDDRRRRNDE